MTPILLDTIVIIVIMLSVLVALFRGFVREVLTIVNLGGAALAAYAFGPMLSPGFKSWLMDGISAGDKTAYIAGVIPREAAAVFLAYACVFFGVFIILSLAGMAISGGVKAMGLGGFDKVLGVLFGAARGFLIVFLLYAPFAFAMTPKQFPDWVKDSVSYSALDATYKAADDYLHDRKFDDLDKNVDPESIRGKLQKMANDGKDKVEDASEDISDNVKDASHAAAESLTKSVNESKDLFNDERKTNP